MDLNAAANNSTKKENLEVRQVKLSFQAGFKTSELYVYKQLAGFPLQKSGAPASIMFEAFIFTSNGKAYPSKVTPARMDSRFIFPKAPPQIPIGLCTIIEARHPDYQFRKASIVIQRGQDTLAIYTIDPQDDITVVIPSRATSLEIGLDSVANILGHLAIR